MVQVYHQTSLQAISKKFSRKNKRWFSLSGHSLLRLASMMRPAAEKSLSTHVDVEGGVRYLGQEKLT